MTQDQAPSSPPARLATPLLALLRKLDTCALANAIETTGVRLRNDGYMDSTVRCLLPESPALVGYALTLRVRTTDPPVKGDAHVERADWWDQLLMVPAPRLLVVQGEPGDPASGSILGEVHAHVYRALGCTGLVTDGAVRDVPALRKMEFPVFAGRISVSHAYAHVVEAGAPVTVGGLEVRTGDLLHGDIHGVLSIPLAVAADLPGIVAQQRAHERAIIEYCRSPGFTVDGLKQMLEQNQS